MGIKIIGEVKKIDRGNALVYYFVGTREELNLLKGGVCIKEPERLRTY